MAALSLRKGSLFVTPWMQCRHRGKINFKHPQTFFERNVMEAITKPILPEQLVPDPVCYRLQRLKLQQPEEEVNLYERFLVRECQKMFAEYQTIVVFQALPILAKRRKLIKNKLFKKDIFMKFFSNSVMRQAIGDTKWANLTPLLNAYNVLVVHKDVNIYDVVNQTKRVPELVMLGGVVGDALLSRAGLLRCAQFPDIAAVHAQLYNTLSSVGAPQLCSTLGSHQVALTASLQQYVKDGAERPESREAAET